MDIQRKIKPLDICVDFDGTLVTHEFPKIGKDIGAIPVLKSLVEKGHRLILFTMRSDINNPINKEDEEITPKGGLYLSEAVNWFNQNGIPLYGIQSNPTQKDWTYSPKAYGQLYIDDAALGCPLINDPEISGKPFVDWQSIKALLIIKGVL